MFEWTPEQQKRLGELGAAPGDAEGGFPDRESANAAFQKLEKRLIALSAEGVRSVLAGAERPEGALLRERLASALASAGFTEVETPLLVGRRLLEKMGLGEDHALQKQIFWVDKNRAVRPMLAPGLYHILADLLRIAGGVVSIFEIGTCMRKESQGTRHAEEFTMLNVVEMGLALEGRRARIEETARLVLEASGLPPDDCSFVTEDSGVYGETLDVVSPGGLELASTAMGPHPLDARWNIHVPWVGLGFGLERLLAAKAELAGIPQNLARHSRSLHYLRGFRLSVLKKGG